MQTIPTFVESMLNVTQVADIPLQLSPVHAEIIMDFMRDTDIYKLHATPDEKYDQIVRANLDQFWPGTTDLQSIKRIEGKVVYLAEYKGNSVIVKSINYSEDALKQNIHDAEFVNYIGQTDSVSTYIDPGVQASDDHTLILTMTYTALGYKPEELPPQDPYTYIFDEKAVRSEAKWWSEFRARSIDYKTANPAGYDDFVRWDEIYEGWQKQFTPITIPVTETSFGVIHGDAHTGNFMMNPIESGEFEMTVYDFDNTQRSWYIVDPGTLIFGANMSMFLAMRKDRLERIFEMKHWFMDSYGWDINEEELKQGCQWRHDFMKYAAVGMVETLPKKSVGWVAWTVFLAMTEAGLIPTC